MAWHPPISGECTTGTFEWYYGREETVFILAGQVKATSPGGQVHVLKAGDIGYFPADTTWLWEVDGYVRKIAFCRKHVPLVLNVPLRGACTAGAQPPPAQGMRRGMQRIALAGRARPAARHLRPDPAGADTAALTPAGRGPCPRPRTRSAAHVIDQRTDALDRHLDHGAILHRSDTE
ncbi:cupin domain-containing protein [Cupriavidus basilensis]